MKYEITFINKNGCSNYNATLTFGDRDAVDVAKKVFGLAVTGHYSGIEIKKVSKSEKRE